MSNPKNKQTAESFWARIDRSIHGCWNWPGKIGSVGYGVVRWHGYDRYAHRTAWETTSGPIPDGLQVLHRCDNRACVNPAHLFLGTMSDNMADKFAKRRHVQHALNADKVREMRNVYVSDGMTYAALARRFGVSPPVARRVILRELWAWVT